MDAIAEEIDRALSAGLYYVALVSTLALPDVCAALESTDGQTKSARYKAWCERWLIPEYPSLTAEDLWYMRCGMVHEARPSHPKTQYTRVLVTLPDPQHFDFHDITMNNALILDAERFCRDMMHATSRWYAANQTDPNVVANLPRLLRLYPTGLAPYITGFPLIA